MNIVLLGLVACIDSQDPGASLVRGWQQPISTPAPEIGDYVDGVHRDLPVAECDSDRQEGCLERHFLTDPDAVCVDGSPGVYYLRTAPEGSPDASRWVVHLQGGGGICVDFDSCLAMWRGGEGSRYGAEKMSSRWAPDAIVGRGIERITERSNRFAGWNHAFLYMCSTDDWTGDSDRLLGSDPGPELLLHFRGARMLAATLAELGAYGFDEAEHVMLTGSSAGGNGARFAADRLREQVLARGGDVRVVVDSAVKPLEDLDLYTSDHFEAYASTGGTRGFDDSCMARHASDPEPCGSPDHVLYNHVTTPVFVRQGLREKRPDGVGVRDWREATGEHILALADLPSTAEDGAEIEIAPGFFAPDSKHHTALLSDARFFGEDPDERVDGVSLHDALWHWLRGEEVGLIAW